MSDIPSIKISPRTFGPVADLEKHLPSDWWKDLFNSLYLMTDGDVFENDANTIQDVDMLIKTFNLKSHQHILDLCCGQGRHVLEFQKRGYENVMGLDRSRYLIRLAKKRAQQQKLCVRFSEGDARKIRLPESNFDCVLLLGNSFGYFESQDDDIAVLHSILQVLKSQGKLVMDIVNGEWLRKNFEKRSWEWIDSTHFVCRERSLSNDKSRIISREIIVNADQGAIIDQFYAERLYTFNEIKTILESLSFTNITLEKNIKAQSTRGQDLGMMENRMIICAIAPTKKVILLPNKKQIPILVLLGDPRLPDKVKRGGQFNNEDLVTIKKLKTALSQLKYNFNYFDHHQKLIDYLRQYKPNFVLNLCDEGFNNQALQELHVPALLEMFNIQYTGSPPACLALCYNKAIVRAIAQSVDIPVPLETYYDPIDQSATLPSIFPALLKPNLGDSSIGITQDAVVYNSEALVNYLDKLKTILPNTSILVQEYLSGDEYSIGVIGNTGNLTFLPFLKVDYSALPDNLPKILGYESKWHSDSPYWDKIQYIPANLNPDTERQLIDYCSLLFERLGCRDYVRFDFREDAEGNIKLLEVNPNPGWCWDGKLNLMANFCGKSYAQLLNIIIETALERVKNNGAI